MAYIQANMLDILPKAGPERHLFKARWDVIPARRAGGHLATVSLETKYVISRLVGPVFAYLARSVVAAIHFDHFRDVGRHNDRPLVFVILDLVLDSHNMRKESLTLCHVPPSQSVSRNNEPCAAQGLRLDFRDSPFRTKPLNVERSTNSTG